jgi:hypothetical protein
VPALDVWLVDSFVGEPQNLDGQCLRWCTRDELREARLLAADLPVVTALRLPAVIESSAGPDFDLVPIEAYAPPAQKAGRSPQDRLIGVMCGSEVQARDAAAAGADFIALSRDIPAAELRHCCERIGRPVYARGISLREAWERGAAGIVALTGSDRRTV